MYEKIDPYFLLHININVSTYVCIKCIHIIKSNIKYIFSYTYTHNKI